MTASIQEDWFAISGMKKAEAFRWCRLLHFRAAALSPASFEAFNVDAVFADGDELGDEQSHHAVEESARLDFHNQQVTLTLYKHLLNCGLGMAPLTSGTLKCGKVMPSDQSIESLAHAAFIEADLIAMPAPRAEEKVGQATIVDCVSIAAMDG